jgi:hypothetical protein
MRKADTTRAVPMTRAMKTLRNFIKRWMWLAWKFHSGIEPRSGENVRRLEITQPNENAIQHFFCDRL